MSKNNKKYYEEHKEYFSVWYQNLVKTPIGRSSRLITSYNQQDENQGRPKGDLTVEWVAEQIQKGCTYKDQCGTTDWRKVGLNRKDNSLPHTKDNCEPCCKKCNDRLAKEKRKKIVDQIDVATGEVLATFPSVKEAAETLGLNKTSISRCCNGGYFDKRKGSWIKASQHGGYKWVYHHLK